MRRDSRRSPHCRTQDHHVQTFDEEDPNRYSPGGYHPVRIGDEFHDGKYRVIRKLGYGLYSTHVALKILTADSFGGEKSTFELDILRHLASRVTESPGSPGANHIVGLQDEFKHSGPNGRHVCLVFKSMGPDMSHYRRLFSRARLSIPVAKKVTKELLMALAFLHDSCQHHAPSKVFSPFYPPHDPPTDYYMKSEQVISGEEELETADVSIRLADFGTTSWVDEHLTEWIQPQMLRAPEVILGAPWDHKVDIWNLGLIIWELVQGKLIFDGQATATSAYSSQAHLAQMKAILGTFPNTLLDRSESHYIKVTVMYPGHLISGVHFPPVTLRELCDRFQYPVGQDLEDFLAFVEITVALEPRNRPDARELLDLRWLRDV
ncbi:kinase-like protein [Xylaria longipes]|nr:kinase-like protein [Xylaria longipes]